MSDDFQQYIVSGWSDLESGVARAGLDPDFPTIPTEMDFGLGPIRLGLTERLERRLLIPVDMRDRIPDKLGGNGISVSAEQYQSVDTGDIARFIDICCLDEALNDVFSEVVREIVRRLKEGISPVRSVSGVMDDFRDLLRKPQLPLSREQILGLVGELHFLRVLLRADPEAMDLWTGPEKARHDFMGASVSVEVKTSIRRDNQAVTIHGIDQLDVQQGSSLYLLHLVVEEMPRGNLTLRGIIDEIMAMEIDREKFAKKLEQSGIQDLGDGNLDEPKLAFISDYLYQVSEEFPCLTRKHLKNEALPIAIGKLQYTIDMSAVSGFRVDDAKRLAAISGLVSK